MMQTEQLYLKAKPYFAVLYFCLLAVILFTGNTHSLTDQDEAAYAGFAKHMIESGNWVTPEFMWSQVHRKPPLHFWNIAISYTIFGVNEFAVRFPSALFVLLTCMLVFVAGKKIVGKQVALLWVVVLSTSLLVPALGKISVTDSTLLFFTTVCAFALYFILQERKWKWVFVFWISFALALLTKGPPVVLFVFVLFALLVLLHPNRKNLIMIHPWFFLPLAFVPLVVWGNSTIHYDGGKLVAWMIDWYILKRVNGGVLGQTGLPGMHLLLIILFFLPWFMFLPRAFITLFTQFIKDKKEGLFFSAWFIAGWFIYELSPSKLPAYVVAAHIPLALFVARTAGEQRLPAKVWMILHYLFAFVLFAGIVVLPFVTEVTLTVKIVFVVTGIVLLSANIISVFLVRTNQFIPSLISVAVLLQLGLWLVLLPAASEYKNTTKKAAVYADENANKASRIIIANDANLPPSLPFYLGAYFKTIEVEHDFSVLVTTYYANAPCVLILNQKQAVCFKQVVPELSIPKFEALPLLKSTVSDYFVLIKNETKASSEKAGLPEWVKPPQAVNLYVEQIRNNSEWMEGVKIKASQRKITVEEMIAGDAKWMYDYDMSKYNYFVLMMQTPRWKTDLEKRAAQKGISLEKLCKEDVEFIFGQGSAY